MPISFTLIFFVFVQNKFANWSEQTTTSTMTPCYDLV
jgi:hypothetical protein